MLSVEAGLLPTYILTDEMIVHVYACNAVHLNRIAYGGWRRAGQLGEKRRSEPVPFDENAMIETDQDCHVFEMESYLYLVDGHWEGEGS